MTSLHLIRRCHTAAISNLAQLLETVSGNQGRIQEELDAFEFPHTRILIDDVFKLTLPRILAGLPKDVVAFSVVEEHAQPGKADTVLLPRHWVVTDHNPIRQRPQRPRGKLIKKLLEMTDSTHICAFDGRRTITVLGPNDRIAWQLDSGRYQITDLSGNELSVVVPAST